MGKKKQSVKEWKKENPERAANIEKILEICDRYHASSLEPIRHPEVKITTSPMSIRL